MANSHPPPLNPDRYIVAHIEHRPDRYRPRSCFNGDGFPKATFPTRADATSTMKEHWGQKWRRDGINVYRCPTCREWHIGHDRRKVIDE